MTLEEPQIKVQDGRIDAVIDVKASLATVFAAITDPNILLEWWGDVDVYKATQWRTDLRVGGRWRSEGVAPGGQEFFVEGEYLEIEAPRRLVYTWNVSWAPLPATEVRWELREIPTGTRVHVTHTGFGANEQAARSHAEARSGGWAGVLGWLTRYLARRS